MRRTAAWALLAATCAGCGPSDTIWVTGTLTKGGTPYAPPTGQKLGVTFLAVEVKDAAGKALPPGEPFAAEIDGEGGAFRVPGPEGRGIPPGKYRVAVVQTLKRDALPASPKRGRKSKDAPGRDTDMLKGRFGPDASPIVRDLKASGAVAIDLDRPSGG